MTDDEVRDLLAAALMDARLIRWREPDLAREFADALMPTIRSIYGDAHRDVPTEHVVLD